MHKGVLYGSKLLRLALTALSLACAVAPAASTNIWQPLTGATSRQEFVAGATAEIQLKPGVTAVGRYHADGTAELEAWNETFQRTWVVKGEDQVCYSSEVETNCFTFKKNSEDPAEFSSRNVKTGEMVVFRILDAMTRTYDRENPHKPGLNETRRKRKLSRCGHPKLITTIQAAWI